MTRLLFPIRTHAAPPPTPDAEEVRALAERLGARARSGRGLALRHISAGGCGGCELELLATRNLLHALESLGVTLVDNPRHADALLLTGPMTRNMAEALAAARAAAGEGCLVLGLGDCAVDGGVFKGSYAVEAPVAADLRIPGCPPTPTQVLRGLLTLMEARV